MLKIPLVQGELLIPVCNIPLFHSEGTHKIHYSTVLGESQLFLSMDNFIISFETEKACKYPLKERTFLCL